VTRFFVHKASLGAVALAVGIAGMALGRRWAVWIAVALLAVAFLLRFGERTPRAP
jgi:hypothetical protein